MSLLKHSKSQRGGMSGRAIFFGAVLLTLVFAVLGLIVACAAIAGNSGQQCDPDSPSNMSVGTPGGVPVYLIGDSIGLGVESDLSAKLGGKLTTQATGGIQLRESIPKLEGDKEKIRNAKSVVIELGTNHDANIEFKPLAQEMVRRVKEINPDATIYWVQIFTPGGITYPESNRVIRNLEGVQVIKTKDSNGNSLVPISSDRIHPSPEGYKKLADLIANAVENGGEVNTANQNPDCPSDDGVSGDFSGDCKADGLAYGLPSTAQSDREAVFGKADGHTNIVSDTFFGKPIQLHKKVMPCLKAAEAELKANGTTYQVKAIGGLRWPPDSLGWFHPYGAAIDINPAENPYCAGGCAYDMPREWVRTFRKYGFFWGGNYRTTKDYMHFEWHGEAP